MSRGRFPHILSGYPALPVTVCVLAVLAATEPRAEETASGPRPALQAGTHMGYSRLSMNLDTESALGRIEYAPRTVARPGVSLRYGSFGLDFASPRLGDAWSTPGRAGDGWNDIRTHWHAGAWGVEAHHLRADGFTAVSTERGRLPDPAGLSLRTSGATAYFAIDPDSKVYRLSQGTEERGGNLDVFVTLAASHARLRAGEAPVEARGSGFDGLRRLDAYGAAAGAGYAFSSNLHGIYLDQALFAGYGPQWSVTDGHAAAGVNLVKVNLRARMGVRGRHFDVGAGFGNDAHAAFVGEESATFHTLVARAHLEVFL